MGRKKYLKDSDIEVNGIYEDSDGDQFLYLGKALWSLIIDEELIQENVEKYIYLKINQLNKYSFNMPLDNIFFEIQSSGLGGCYKCSKLRKMIKIIDVDKRNCISDTFNFVSFFQSHKIIETFRFC